MSKVAKIAVSGLPFHLDRPYDYAIPERLEPEVEPGRRVLVPFTNSNRPREGLVLALRDESAFEKLKPIGEVLDAEPMGGCFINANTPEELRAIEESLLD